MTPETYEQMMLRAQALQLRGLACSLAVQLTMLSKLVEDTPKKSIASGFSLIRLIDAFTATVEDQLDRNIAEEANERGPHEPCHDSDEG